MRVSIAGMFGGLQLSQQSGFNFCQDSKTQTNDHQRQPARIDMTFTVGIWIFPILGFIVAWVYHKMNYIPGGYLPDMFTGMVSAAIFIGSCLFTLGLWLGG